MLFNLTYGCYSLLIEIPRDADNSTDFAFESIPFPPIPFYTTTEETWDLSENEVSKDVKHSITLNFDTMIDYTGNVEMSNEKGDFEKVDMKVGKRK